MTDLTITDKRICGMCHKDISWRAPQARYCSRKCSTDYVLLQALGPILEHECESCGNKFTAETRHRKKFCSVKCLFEKTRQNTRQELKEIVCGFCMNRFKQSRPNQVYCEAKCRVGAMNFAYRNGLTMPEVRAIEVAPISKHVEAQEPGMPNYPKPAKVDTCPICERKECVWYPEWNRFGYECKECADEIIRRTKEIEDAKEKEATPIENSSPAPMPGELKNEHGRVLEDWEIPPFCETCKVNRTADTIESKCGACKQKILDQEVLRQVAEIENAVNKDRL